MNEWQRSAPRGQDRISFKDWLWESKGVKTNAEHLREVALDTTVPNAMAGLVNMLRDALAEV